MPHVSPTPPARSCKSLHPITHPTARPAPILRPEVVAEEAEEAVEATGAEVAVVPVTPPPSSDCRTPPCILATPLHTLRH